MPAWREIMAKAEEAKRILLNDREAGEKLFENLLEKSPRDPMVYFKRGEAWEALQLFDLAVRDFREGRRFPKPEWGQRAKDSVDRCEEAIRFTRGGEAKAMADARIDCPVEVKPIFDKAWERLGNDPLAGCVLARSAMESIVVMVSKRCGLVQDMGTSLFQRIETLKAVLPGAAVGYMHTIRVLGNEAAHGGQVSTEGARVVQAALAALMKEIDKLSHQK